MVLSDKIPAPALAKGLRLLDQLAVDGQASLEKLAARNAWPKSSTLRYLQTLETLGAVSRHPETLHWHAEKCLKPVSGKLPEALEHFRRELPQLADQSGHCAELYRVENRTIRLIDRAEPEGSEVQVQARIGFLRDLRELDATAGIYYAWTGTHPPASAWYYEDAVRTTVPEAAQLRILNRIRETRIASDHSFNENGIRRHAIPIEHEDGLVGILAIAQHLTPKFRIETERIIQCLSHLTPKTEQQTGMSVLRS